MARVEYLPSSPRGRSEIWPDASEKGRDGRLIRYFVDGESKMENWGRNWVRLHAHSKTQNTSLMTIACSSMSSYTAFYYAFIGVDWVSSPLECIRYHKSEALRYMILTTFASLSSNAQEDDVDSQSEDRSLMWPVFNSGIILRFRSEGVFLLNARSKANYRKE